MTAGWTSEQAEILARIERIGHRLDARYRIPMIGVRFGWDVVISLVPVIGDLVSAGLYGALAIIFWGVKAVIQGHAPSLIVAIFHYLAWINVALAVFNLVPGYPLDGGRILRAIIWWRTGSVAGATKWASDIGKGFAWALMILGAFQLFTGALIAGLWLIFIGMFLRGIAAAGYQEVMMKQSLDGVRVEEVRRGRWQNRNFGGGVKP